MKYTIALILTLAAFLCGCATTSQSTWQNTAGKTLATAATTVDAAMKGWAIYVANSHSTPTQEAVVRDAYIKYQSAMMAAQLSYQTAVTTQDETVWQRALSVLVADEIPLLNTISQFQGVK